MGEKCPGFWFLAKNSGLNRKTIEPSTSKDVSLGRPERA